MPVTIRIPACKLQAIHGIKPCVPNDFLPWAVREGCKEVIQTSIELPHPSDSKRGAAPAKHGFLASVVNAYNGHHNLEILPEDVWFAILTQLSAYIVAHAEELRHHFVTHEGQKELVIEYEFLGGRHAFDLAVFAAAMSDNLHDNLTDKSFHEWIMPNFTTTTDNDEATAAIITMATMQKYFSFTCVLGCGLPSIKLHGEKSDWQSIYDRLDKLRTWGSEPAQFCDLLGPVIARFVESFDAPENPDVLDFWARIAHRHANGSKTRYLSGWITAFCFWTEKGRCLYDTERGLREYNVTPLELDGVGYHLVDEQALPNGWVEIPVKLIDKGKMFRTAMLAGSLGSEYCASGKTLEGGKKGLDTIRPVVGWFMYERK